jgi:hypothetical protein
MLKELLDLEDGLSGWELEFVENISRRMDGENDDLSLSEKQEDKLKQIWEKLCNR